MGGGAGNRACVWQLVLAHLWKLTLAHLWKLTGPDGDAMCPGLKRSESPDTSSAINQPAFLLLPFSIVRRKR